MTTRVIASDVIASTNAVELDASERVLLGKAFSLVSTAGNGVNGFGGGHSIGIFGTVDAAVDGIGLTGSTAASIQVGRSGSIAAQERGIAVNGDGTRVINFGDIASLDGPAIALSQTIFPTNHAPDDFTIKNFGTISGYVGISISDLGANITNRGTIVGTGFTAIIAGDGINQLRNYGTIIGGVDLGDGGNYLLNRGMIDGAFYTGSGQDFVDNRGGNITGTVNLGGGTDTFIPGASAEVASGGSGNDTLDLQYGGAFVLALDASLENGGSIESDSFSLFENVLGSKGNDTIIGDSNDNSLSGFDGNDTLSGGSGKDYLDGGNGNDRLTGGLGNDNLSGGAGIDVLTGGAGTDTLTGGIGADIFVFDATSLGANPALADTILDLGTGDKIDLSAIDANTVAAKNNVFTYIGVADFQKIAGELRFELLKTNLYEVQGDINGDGIADLTIHLTATKPLPDSFIL